MADTDCPGNELLEKIRENLAKIFFERENALRSNIELRKLCKAAYHALSSIIAHREGIPTPTLQDLANKLNAAAGGVEA